MMEGKIGYVALLVRDYDEAIQYFTEKLQFRLVEDTQISEVKRWVVVAPAHKDGCGLLLAKASTPEQETFIGSQTGGRVFLFLHTDDFWRDYRYMKSNGVVFIEEPRMEDYGAVVVFKDLYGNKWDLVERKQK